jgi:hypothetical protein
MAYTTVFNDIVFVEGEMQTVQIGDNIEYDAGNQTTFNKHLKSLKDVKEYFAEVAKNNDYNAIINFTYGQKSKHFMFDNITFWGKGLLANISTEEYDRIKNKK